MIDIAALYLDCCLPDYFQGSAAEEVLAVPVSHNTTYAQALRALADEWRNTTDGYFSRYGEVVGADIDQLGVDALRSLFAVICEDQLNDVADFALNIEPAGDDAPSVYLYVGMMEVR